MSFLSVLAQAAENELFQESYETYDMTTNNGVSDEVAVAAFAGMMMFFLIAAVIGYVVHAFLLSRIFKKAGVEEWKAWVPVYNAWVTLELGGQKGLWAVLMLVPVVNIVAVVFLIIAQYNIGLKFGKEGVFVLLAIFLPIVWLAWLAFDKSTWQGAKPAAAAPAAPAQPTAPAAEEPKPPVPPTAPPAAS